MPSPIEPPPTRWRLPGPADWADDDDLVALGADWQPGTLLAAYRLGLFPMPLEPGEVPAWFSPRQRGVLSLDNLQVSRSLRRSLRDFEVRVDTAFVEVMRACADPTRTGAWIDEQVLAAYTRLHELGWAHSVEAWQGGRLVGGLYGVSIGGLFAGESMFHHVTDASKVALVGLVERLRDEYADERLLDVQWSTPHLASLGVTQLPRAAYVDRLREALTTPSPPGLGTPG